MGKWRFSQLNTTQEIVSMANQFEDRLNSMAGQIGGLKSKVEALQKDDKPKSKKKDAGKVRVGLIVLLAFLVATVAVATNRTVTYNRVSNPQQLRGLLQDWADEFDDDWQLFRPRTSTPTASEGMMYYNDTANSFYFYNGTSWVAFANSSGDSLDNAYDLGSKIDVDGDALELEVDDGSNNSALLIDHDEATNDNPAMLITNAADDNAAVSIQIDGTAGYDLQGTGDTWEISIAGLLTTSGGITTESGGDITMTGGATHVVWDSSESTLEVLDQTYVAFGTTDDVLIMYDETTDDALEITAAAADKPIHIGGTSAGFDITYYHETSGTVLLDYDGNLVIDGITTRINDDDDLVFGDSSEFVIEYDEDGDDDLIIVAATANDQVLIGDETTGTDFVCVSSGGTAATHAAWFDASGNTNQGIWKFGNDDHGLDVEFYGETASQLVTWDQSADTWYFGDDGEGIDVMFNADTGSDYIMWDESDEALEAVGAQIHLDDDSSLQLGSTAGDVTLTFNGTDFLIDASTADEGLKIGDTTTGFDLTYYFETAGTIDIDYDGDNMAFSDQMTLNFGTNDDVTLMYDETTDDNFEIAAGSVGMSITTNDFITTTDGAAANQFKVDATGTVAGDAIVFETTDGGVQINADGAANGDIAIDAADDMTLTAAGDLTLAVTGTLKGGGATVDNIKMTAEVVTGTTDVLTATQSGQTIIYTQTGGACTVTLPEATAATVGVYFWLVDGNPTGAVDLKVDPEGDGQINGDTAGNYIENQTDADGCAVLIVCTAADTWYAVYTPSAWAEE